MRSPIAIDTTQITEHIRNYLNTRTTDFETGFIFSEEIARALGLEVVSSAALSAAVQSLAATPFYLIVRGPDDFSSLPYVWVSARPDTWKSNVPPETCWVIRSPDGQASLRVAEGLLVFSRMGYANGHATSLGIGDFNLQSFSWSELAQAPGRSYDAAVIDFVAGEAKVTIPFA